MGKRLPEVLTQEEQRALINQPTTRYLTGLRDKCMILCMLRGGFRVSELLSLRVDHINWNTGKVHIHEGKGHKDRVIYLDEETMTWLKKWLERKPLYTSLVFPTLEGTQLGPRHVQQMLKRRAKKAGITKNVHPHLLRHTMATDLLNEGANIRIVQKALGHADLSTTMIYTHITDGDLEKAMKRRGV